uniref:Uncharacterized protein n=1 Tax=Anthurium amnicola TaxID=1678845 RepID=A0A1D1Z4Q9_9ARAE
MGCRCSDAAGGGSRWLGGRNPERREGAGAPAGGRQCWASRRRLPAPAVGVLDGVGAAGEDGGGRPAALLRPAIGGRGWKRPDGRRGWALPEPVVLDAVGEAAAGTGGWAEGCQCGGGRWRWQPALLLGGRVWWLLQQGGVRRVVGMPAAHWSWRILGFTLIRALLSKLTSNPYCEVILTKNATYSLANAFIGIASPRQFIMGRFGI